MQYEGTVLVCFSVAMIKYWPKPILGGRGVFQLTLPHPSLSLKESKGGSLGRNVKARTEAKIAEETVYWFASSG